MCLAMMAELSISGFPRGSVGKESTCNAGDTGDMGSFPGFLEEGLENPLVRGDWWAIDHRVAKSQTRLKRPST